MDTTKTISTLDIESINEAIDILGDRFQILVDGYIEDTKCIFASIDIDRAGGGFESISQSLHSLKSSSYQVGAQRVSQHSAEIEKFMHEHRDNISSLVFQTQFERLIDQLRTYFLDYQREIKIYLGNRDK